MALWADDELARLLPRHRFDRLLPGAAGALERFRGAVLSVDIAGFSGLTEQLTAGAAPAAETVARSIHRVLGSIVEIAAEAGGSLSHLAGDAAYLFWRAATAEDWPACVGAAGRAGLAIQAAAQGQLGSEPIRLRASLGVGELYSFELASSDSALGWLAGEAFADAARADAQSSPGTVTLSPRAWGLMQAQATGVPLPSGCVRLLLASGSARPVAAPAGALPLELLVRALPVVVSERRAAGSIASWPGELRTASVVFARLGQADEAGATGLARAMARLLPRLAALGGSVFQLVADGVGMSLIVLLGLPPLPQEATPPRAVATALALADALRAEGIENRIGVASGPLFCAVFGGEALHFEAVGGAMNLAARLAGLDGQGIVVDDATWQAARSAPGLAARRLPPVPLRGLAQPVLAHEVVRRAGAPRAARPVASPAPLLIGRERELARGLLALDELAAGRGAVLQITAEAGGGKSTLALAILAEAAQRGFREAIGRAEALAQHSEYAPWRSVLRDLLEGRQLAVWRDRLGDAGVHLGLLNDIVDENEALPAVTAGLTESGRAALRAELLERCLMAAAQEGPLVVVLEDLHWADVSSIGLIERLAAAALPIVLLLTSRPTEPALAVPTLALGGLSLAATGAVFAHHANAARTDAELLAVLYRLTGGTPYFVAEVSRLLGAQGRLALRSGTVGLGDAVPGDDLIEVAFGRAGVPSTLEGTIMARFDALPLDQQAVLRLLSVAGSGLSGRLLAALAGPDGAAAISELCALGVVASDGAWIGFAHALFRDVVYAAVPLSERQALHGRLAALLADEAGAPAHAVLAYHHERAGALAAAVAHLTAAGHEALHNNANRDARWLFAHALELVGPSAADGRDIDIRLGWGEAAQRLSLYEEAERQKHAALERLGVAIPKPPLRLIAALLGEVAQQIGHRRRRPRAASGSRSDRLRLSAETAGLVEIYYYLGAALSSLCAALRSLNLAEGFGDSPELARGYAIVGTIAGFAKLPGVAKRYGERALDVLQRIDAPAAHWWVCLVVGVSRLSAGDLDQAAALMRRTAEVTARIGDRRHWCDAIENLGIIATLRADWNAALASILAYREVAEADRDPRYRAAALREQAFVLMHLGRLVEAEGCLSLLRRELDDGLMVERDAALQDLHAMAATLALDRGDEMAAAQALAACVEAIGRSAAGSNFPNMHGSMLLACRTALRLAARRQAAGEGGAAARHRREGRIIVRALEQHAGVHAVGRAAALLARAALAEADRRPAQVQRLASQAARAAAGLGLVHDATQAEHALRVAGGGVALELRPDRP